MKTKLPKVRTTEIVEQELENELLLYHLTTNKMYSLNETSKIVFKACDGTTTFDDLKRQYKYTEELIYLSLDELKKNDLIEIDYVSPLAGMNRREVVRKIGLACAVALPVIGSIVAPTSTNAASGTRAFGQTCDSSAQCASGAPYCSVPLGGGIGQGSQVCCRSQGAVVGAGYSYIGTYLRGPNNNICGNCGANYAADACCSNTTRYNTCTDNGNGTVNCSYTCQ